MKDMKPCPFCGGIPRARLKVFQVDDNYVMSSRFIQCSTCLAQTRMETVKTPAIKYPENEHGIAKQEYDFVMEAIDGVDYLLMEAWNRRAE